MYPSYIIDNFFDDPDVIVKLANSIPFHRCTLEMGYNNHPGERTDYLHSTHNDFFRWSGLRMLAAIFPNEKISFTAKASFQKISKKLSEVDFIHQDKDTKLTAVVYLNKNGSSGTSLFKPKTFVTLGPEGTLKYDYYQSPEKYKGDKLKQLRMEKEALRDKFNETASVAGVYNRLFMFDGHQYHSQHLDINNEERLTYIVFFSKIESPNAPLEMMRKI